ncbi:Abi-alpha family protein [Antrihabitans sp. YC2-6]|uniref:Abi-alpha family protein n=1 Tax=Antrihabitans sp. YC2-6 TaxID=2799498 RepID=UPI0018F2B8D5|nr:Abi-alpha family protein [Antrihabitans sp. YC2-6]MBJ8344676.1 DUF4393 domain-containing protein [Antrihabitans sp. YC2-6]
MRDSVDGAMHDLGALADAVGDQVRPVASFAVETADSIVSAVESARSAGASIWKALNVLSDRARSDDHAEPSAEDVAPAVDLAAGAASDAISSAESARSAGNGIWKMLNDVRRDPLSAAGGVLDPLRRVSEPAVVKNVVTTVGGLSTGLTAGILGSDEDLRAVGNKLIALSQKPHYEAGGRHPAFSHILHQLNPDEARMLRFLAKAGVQPAIDIRTKTLFQIGSERLAGGINMIAEMASCRWPEHNQQYLSNLNRLGLVVFSKEPVDDFRRYALLEVQPRAMEAIETVKSAITIYRSIYLSGFGKQFCDVCFDLTGYTAGGWDKDERGDKMIGSGPPAPRKHSH